ncbi:MAG TPA: DNA polymerase III subunit chi [Steroidobacteraceae bacterium]
MARVDFYVLSDAGSDARLRFACRLAEEAVDQGQRVYLQTSSMAEALRLDELLWTFNDRSFLAHEIATAAGPSHPRVMVLLGESEAPPTHRDVLINLSGRVPDDLDAYGRIAEIVDPDPERKQLSRERYKQYRARGCTLETHNV